MTKTLLAVAFFGLTVVGLAGCGSSSSTDDVINDMCNKMDSCGFLEGTGMTVSECKSEGKSSSGEATSAEIDAAKKCLDKSCTEFVSCISAMP